VKLLLLDGNSLTYRAFFALPTDMATSSGQVTNAVFGFTSMLVNLLKDHQPDGVLVAFDRPEPTFRHEQYSEYKAQREASPDILRQQMGLVREVCAATGVTTVDLVGFEADDIIATMAERAKQVPVFLGAVASVAQQKFIPQTGAVLITDATGAVIGAAGASGGTGDEDEQICIAGAAAAGLGHA
jgi:hypothetical protein